MSLTQYYLLGQHVYNLKDKVNGLLCHQGSGTTSKKKLEQAKEFLNTISESIKEGKDNFDDYYCLFEAACHYVYSYVGEVEINETSDVESDDDTSEDSEEEEESILANVLM